MTEGSATKHRRKAAPAPQEIKSETNSPAAKAATASAGANSDVVTSAAIDSVGVIAPTPNAGRTEPKSEARHEDIAKLAHSYWIARGRTHGSPEEDWLRAERELNAKR